MTIGQQVDFKLSGELEAINYSHTGGVLQMEFVFKMKERTNGMQARRISENEGFKESIRKFLVDYFNNNWSEYENECRQVAFKGVSNRWAWQSNTGKKYMLVIMLRVPFMRPPTEQELKLLIT